MAHCNLGVALRGAGRLPEAIEHYQETLRLKPGHAETCHKLCTALVESGRPSEAIKFAKEAAQESPNDPEANRFVAWLMATHDSTQGGDPQQAVELAKRASLLTHHRDIGCLDTLAAAYASAGRFSEAVAMAKEAWQIARSAGQNALAEEIHIRLQLYRDRKPYHELTPGPPKGSP
jgi:tetratricopeptide (TPR) repeat protein